MLGDNLRKWRKERNLTQAQLGKKIGVTGAYIQQLELGKKTNPSFEVFMKLCNALKIAPFDLDYKFEFGDNELLDYITNKNIDNSHIRLEDLDAIDSDLSSKIESILSDYNNSITIEELKNLLNNLKSHLLNLLTSKFEYYDNLIKLQNNYINNLQKQFDEALAAAKTSTNKLTQIHSYLKDIKSDNK